MHEHKWSTEVHYIRQSTWPSQIEKGLVLVATKLSNRNFTAASNLRLRLEYLHYCP